MNKLKRFVKSTPFLRNAVVFFMNLRPFSFENSNQYWTDRYKKGGNSGAGSYGQLAQFKANVLNRFVSEKTIQSVIELGCGDGSQLLLAEYPSYIGFDISEDAINLCNSLFTDDESKTFAHIDDRSDEKADLAISLDVIYHLVEDSVFQEHLDQLFDSASRFVIIYSSNADKLDMVTSKHVKHRNFTVNVGNQYPDWTLVDKIDNQYPYNGIDEETSFSDFYIYGKK